MMDADTSKQIDADEFQQALTVMGIHLKADDVTAIFKALDLDGSGNLELSEFEGEINADLAVGAAGQIATDAQNKIDLRSIDDAEAVLKATQMDDGTPSK